MLQHGKMLLIIEVIIIDNIKYLSNAPYMLLIFLFNSFIPYSKLYNMGFYQLHHFLNEVM